MSYALGETSNDRPRFRTELILERDGPDWVVTQHDVEVHGHGSTALEAVVDYCQELESHNRDGG